MCLSSRPYFSLVSRSAWFIVGERPRGEAAAEGARLGGEPERRARAEKGGGVEVVELRVEKVGVGVEKMELPSSPDREVVLGAWSAKAEGSEADPARPGEGGNASGSPPAEAEHRVSQTRQSFSPRRSSSEGDHER